MGFVSAAFTNHGGVSVVGNSAEISKLPVCPALTAALKTATGAFTNPTTTAWVPNADGSEWLYVMEKPCICGAFAATTGRVCEATGNANPKGQSYRPRCDDNAIPTAYTAGCWCGADDVFTTANTDKSAGPGMTMGVANTDGVVTAEAQVCGTRARPRTRPRKFVWCRSTPGRSRRSWDTMIRRLRCACRPTCRRRNAL